MPGKDNFMVTSAQSSFSKVAHSITHQTLLSLSQKFSRNGSNARRYIHSNLLLTKHIRYNHHHPPIPCFILYNRFSPRPTTTMASHCQIHHNTRALDNPGGGQNKLDCLLDNAKSSRHCSHLSRRSWTDWLSLAQPPLNHVTQAFERPEIGLRLKVLDYVWGEETGVESVDLGGDGMRDISGYLEGMSEGGKGEVRCAEGIVGQYGGSVGSWIGMVVDCGVVERVVELGRRMMVRGCVEEERRRTYGEDMRWGSRLVSGDCIDIQVLAAGSKERAALPPSCRFISIPEFLQARNW
ncbi:hypothetical protein BKA65DRAFT_589852 [Rhexocercosporidium sp. MPI-PUGE-AT-0058]|nr:hypothetical protein BKA65DRAFT_589852 [Rhexocercosporidium sp. MPI-PUGE-AT-0058]